MKRIVTSMILTFVLILMAACSTSLKTADKSVTTPVEKAPVKTLIGVIEVTEGEMLERDIIPQLISVFSLTDQEVKDKLAAARSSNLINAGLTDFRRMEGMIPPGKYDIYEGTTLDETIASWIAASEKRYSKILSSITLPNELLPAGQLTLASIVEAECLAGVHHEETASVFLNRMKAGAKLRSCVTAEYALGFQRSFLLSADVAVASPYNTYYVDGLPLGPICVASDSSLKAAMSQSTNEGIYYFYYDYIQNEMYFFSDYREFKKSAIVSKEQFKGNSQVGVYDKINKQELY